MRKILRVLIGVIAGGAIGLFIVMLLGPNNASLVQFLLGYDEISTMSQHENFEGMFMLVVLGEILLGALIGGIIGFLIKTDR